MSKYARYLNDPSLNQFVARAMRNRDQGKAYMASRAWYLRKQAVGLRCNGKCERCKTGKYEIAHHLTYVHYGYENISELQGLCRACHAFLHGWSTIDPGKSQVTQLALNFK